MIAFGDRRRGLRIELGTRTRARDEALRLKQRIMVGLDARHPVARDEREHLVLEAAQDMSLQPMAGAVEMGDGQIESRQLVGGERHQFAEMPARHVPALAPVLPKCRGDVRKGSLQRAHHALCGAVRAAEALDHLFEGHAGAPRRYEACKLEQLVGLCEGHASVP